MGRKTQNVGIVLLLDSSAFIMYVINHFDTFLSLPLPPPPSLAIQLCMHLEPPPTSSSPKAKATTKC